MSVTIESTVLVNADELPPGRDWLVTRLPNGRVIAFYSREAYGPQLVERAMAAVRAHAPDWHV